MAREFEADLNRFVATHPEDQLAAVSTETTAFWWVGLTESLLNLEAKYGALTQAGLVRQLVGAIRKQPRPKRQKLCQLTALMMLS